MLEKKIGGIEMSKRVAGEGTIYFDKSMQRFVGQFPYKDLETGKTKRKKNHWPYQKGSFGKGAKFQIRFRSRMCTTQK